MDHQYFLFKDPKPNPNPNKDPSRRVIRFSTNKDNDIVEITTWLVKKNDEETVYTLCACVTKHERLVVNTCIARHEWESFVINYGFSPISSEEIKAGVCRWVEYSHSPWVDKLVNGDDGKGHDDLKRYFPTDNTGNTDLMKLIEKFEVSYRSQLTHNTQYALEA
jgi:hypothetical protein